MNVRILCRALSLAMVAASVFADKYRVADRDLWADVLANMPVNADRRCVGISLVAEALFEGTRKLGRPPEAADTLASRIYSTAHTDQPIDYPVATLVNGRPVSTVSTESLDRLTHHVFCQYRRDYFRMIADPQACQTLTTTMAHPIATREALTAVLRADADGVEVFCGQGTRTFPDGTRHETHHAFLLAYIDDDIVVYDPNDFAAPTPCRLAELHGCLHVSWNCTCRDEQVETEQTYLVIGKRQYFAAFAKVGSSGAGCDIRIASSNSFDRAWNSSRMRRNRVLRLSR